MLRTDAPIVGTGIEAQVARDSRTQIMAEREGEVVFVDATCIKIKYDRSEDEEFVSFEDAVKTYNIPKCVRLTKVRLSICVRSVIVVSV